MIEKLLNLRVLVYKRDDKSEMCEWKLSKRFYDYPHEFAVNSSSLYLFSPNLRSYVQFNKELKILEIKSTLLEESLLKEKVKIPIIGGLENEFEAKEAVKRFTWVTNKTFLIASHWGFEKYFFINDDGTCLELGSSQIPSFG